MRIRLLAVGSKMPGWVEEGVDTYRKRLPRDFNLEIEEIALGQRGKNADIAKARAQEAQRIRDKLRGDEYVVAWKSKVSHGPPSSWHRKPAPGAWPGAILCCLWVAPMALSLRSRRWLIKSGRSPR